MAALPPGLVFRIARDAGLQFPDHGTKRPICCPFHDDKHPSAFLDGERNAFFCSVCTIDVGWSAKRFSEALGAPWPLSGIDFDPHAPRPEVPAPPAFTAEHAQRTWDAALARTRDDAFVEDDKPAYSYLADRGLAAAWEERTFGIVAEAMSLPTAIKWWPGCGYRIVAPLYDDRGNIVNMQARSVGIAGKRVLFPPGGRAQGTLFANRLGLRLLLGEWRDAPVAILGEGLTDYLALSLVSSVPVMAVPGAQFAASGIGSWVAGLHLYLALDQDRAGDQSIVPASDRAYRLGAERVLRLRWPDGLTDACNALAALGPDSFAQFLDEVVGEPRDA